MAYFEEELKQILNCYDNLIDLYSNVIRMSPDGRLIYQKNHNHDQFLLLNRENGVRTRTCITRDEELKSRLAQKEFADRALQILKTNADALREAEGKMVPFDPSRIMESMSGAYALLPDEYFFDRDMLSAAAGMDDGLQAKVRRHEEWWKMPYKEYWGYPQHKTRTTSRGQKVRSISELLIAEKLYEYNIPFHYEEELEIGGKTFAPDFTFEGADYKCFYLDYFGMMDNEGYARRNLLKLGDYYNAGLIPGDNLIVAFNLSGILNAGTIKAIIETEIIPRL